MISRFVIGLALLICFAGCEKRRSEATVIGKEYIAPAASAASPSVSPKHPKLQTRGGDDAEITVDSYVMKRSVRGTGLDPRALKDEQSTCRPINSIFTNSNWVRAWWLNIEPANTPVRFGRPRSSIDLLMSILFRIVFIQARRVAKDGADHALRPDFKISQ